MPRSARSPFPGSRGLMLAATFLGALACGGGHSGGGDPPPPPPVNGPAWWGYGRDAQHSAQGAIATQPLKRIRWSTTVDLDPQIINGDLFAHYGSPVITPHNTVLVPVKTGAMGGFRVEAHAGATGAVLWKADTDYQLPNTGWTPPMNMSLTQAGRLYFPGSGGKVFYRDNPDSASGSLQTAVFYEASVYASAQATYDTNVQINTPITTDAKGNVYFGFIASGPTSASLVSGLARIDADGTGTWVSATSASGDAGISKVAMNCAPALSMDGNTVYVAVNTAPIPHTPQTGYLLALDSHTLATQKAVALVDPVTGNPARIPDSGTASPTVGPDGDVFYGVLESNVPGHNDRGWLLHFDATLGTAKTPGSFGWDDTASILPASMVPSYTGPSTYLLTTKYNNYGGAGTGDGQNRVAVLDPGQSQTDGIAAIQVMKEVLTVLGVTPDPEWPGGVREWCINSAAVDPVTKSILVNCEDGYLYRWDLTTNTLTEHLKLSAGLGEAYTPTAIGPDGAVYAINDATLFCTGQ